MAYQKLKGDQVFDGEKFLPAGHVVILDKNLRKVDIVREQDAGEDVQYVKGLVTPGFVNAHCHVELSHMKNVIPPHTRLVPFLKTVVQKREFPAETIQDAIGKAIDEMKADGIVGVGDICNTADTAPFKPGSGIYWKNFIEVLSFTDARAVEHIARYNAVLDHFNRLDAGISTLSPHAPYSISEASFRMINEATEGRTISIHNQETPAEDELFRTGGGEFLELFGMFGMPRSPFRVTGMSSIRSWLPYFDRGQKILLIHNSFMPEEDVDWSLDHAARNGLRLVYCFCVNANLYIEDRLPPLEQFDERNCRMALGTDSYSSNWQLKMSAEIATIRQRYPGLPLEKILHWATLGGADALDMEPAWIAGSDILERLDETA